MTPTHDDVVLPMPPNAPRVKPNRFTRWLGRTILKLGRWRMVGEIPDIPRLVLIGAPHSSNWDGLWGFAAKMALSSEERRVGTACVSTCRARWSQSHEIKNTNTINRL